MPGVLGVSRVGAALLAADPVRPHVDVDGLLRGPGRQESDDGGTHDAERTNARLHRHRESRTLPEPRETL